MSIPRAEFPRPGKQRTNWMNLNGQWEFSLFPVGSKADETAFAAQRSRYETEITVPFSWVCPLSGVERKEAGVGWYRRKASFDCAERVFLCFGAVDYLADVYVNGEHVGHHQGGYTTFSFEVTKQWRTGASAGNIAENIIEVRAEDYRHETQTYGKQGYGEIQGIWQTVWLEARPMQYIESFRFDTKCSGAISLHAQVCASDGDQLTATFDGKSWSAPVQGGEVQLDFTLEHPRLWSPDDPYLYEGELSLGEDWVATYFGVREISTGLLDGRGYRWILLNGKPIYLNGTLDQAFNPKGHFTYPSDEDMRAEAWRLKRLGLNMVRIHIKPEESRKLYWMDKLGILVIADVPCFWGPPNAEARAAYEHEWPDMLRRDWNHPSVFMWVMFNESWGLLDRNESGEPFFSKDTQDWVRDVYRRAKELDSTRIIEDNSPCRYDHVESDINTWHFYLNGYEIVRDHIREVVAGTHPGSSYNYIGGNVQGDAPLMNSECGMVWGVDGSAGDSDLAWQYHYMLNEYRLHEKMCGFVFTEFHDVVNEFNGYYRIDDEDKDFGYQDFCRGMSLRDLHAADFVATDCAPCRTADVNEDMEVPLVLSSFSDRHHGQALTLAWELWHDGLDGRVSDAQGSMALPKFGYGTTSLNTLRVAMPAENAVAVLSLYLQDAQGAVISRNFVTFDVRTALPENILELPVSLAETTGFDWTWQTLGGDKLCLGGGGEARFQVSLPESALPNSIDIFMEAGSKRVLRKDRKEIGEPERDLGFMRGYLVDRGSFDNSYWMSDETRFPSEIEVLIDGKPIAEHTLQNDWADARGVLSWHAQPNPRKLDEAGSFGERLHIELPSRLIPGVIRKGGFELTIRVKGEGGLALYGRNCGRYPHGLLVRVR